MKQICTVRLCDKRPPAHPQRSSEGQWLGEPKFLPGLSACPQPSAHQRPISTNHDQHKSRWESKLRIQRKDHPVQAPPSAASGEPRPQCPGMTPTTTSHQEKLYRASFRLRAVAVQGCRTRYEIQGKTFWDFIIYHGKFGRGTKDGKRSLGDLGRNKCGTKG